MLKYQKNSLKLSRLNILVRTIFDKKLYFGKKYFDESINII